MTYSGSIVIKKTRLLDLSDDLKYMWRSKISDGARHSVFGQQITLDRIMEGEFCESGLREYAQYNWYDPCKYFGEWINRISLSLPSTTETADKVETGSD